MEPAQPSARSLETMSVEVDRGVARITFDHPPINLITFEMVGELDAVSREVEANDDVRAVVLQSANPDFFLAHFDIDGLDVVKAITEKPPEPTAFNALIDRFRMMPKATIAKVRGRARGAGSEILLGCDMRFAAPEAILGQPEIMLGFPPGGGAVTRLRRLTGRGRALEIMLSGQDYPAPLAAEYGWINRVVPDEELDDFVQGLAERIATYPAEGIRILKEAFTTIEETTTTDGLCEESLNMGRGLRTPEAERRSVRFIELGGQTEPIERDLGSIFEDLVAQPKASTERPS
jgi:enoyl-CoA hydratase/carnithine racemase